MPGTGLAAPNRVALGENARMMIGGNKGALDGAFIRFVNGVAAIGGNPIDTQDNMSAGYTSQTRSGRNCNITADCFYRSADNPFAFAPKLQPLEETPRVIVWPDFLNDPTQYIKLPVGFCLGFTITAAGAGDVRFSLNLTNQDIFYHPANPDPAGVAN